MLDAWFLEHGARALMWLWLLAFGGAGIFEHVAELRRPSGSVTRRWLRNLGLTGINGLVLRGLLPLSGVALAVAMEQRNAGLLRALDVPLAAAIAVTIVAQDLRGYVYHRLLHRWPALWRAHRVHHSDVDFDVSTALRSHPLEALGAALSRLAVVALLGAPVAAVVIYELLYTTVTFVSHVNARLPARLERALRRLLITPDLHRVHHSAEASESRTNFGVVFSVWDRLFGTLRGAEPAGGHTRMRIGLPGLRDPEVQTLPWLLLQPFRSEAEAPEPGPGPAPAPAFAAHPTR